MGLVQSLSPLACPTETGFHSQSLCPRVYVCYCSPRRPGSGPHGGDLPGEAHVRLTHCDSGTSSDTIGMGVMSPLNKAG